MYMKRLLLFAALALFGTGCVEFFGSPPEQSIACTADAKLCPDGSYVGRTGPKCEFAPCPAVPNPDTTGKRCTGPSDTSCGRGYACTQECGPPVVRDTDPAPGYSCYPAGRERICPICLASNTYIATPNGQVNVAELKPGMLVLTQDAQGNRVVKPIRMVTRTAAPKTHHVTHLLLNDGREVWISPNHPTADGRKFGDLKPGDFLDGSRVRTSESVLYWDQATYDLLPEGETGTYWANGILTGSTLN